MDNTNQPTMFIMPGKLQAIYKLLMNEPKIGDKVTVGSHTWVIDKNRNVVIDKGTPELLGEKERFMKSIEEALLGNG